MQYSAHTVVRLQSHRCACLRDNPFAILCGHLALCKINHCQRFKASFHVIDVAKHRSMRCFTCGKCQLKQFLAAVLDVKTPSALLQSVKAHFITVGCLRTIIHVFSVFNFCSFQNTKQVILIIRLNRHRLQRFKGTLVNSDLVDSFLDLITEIGHKSVYQSGSSIFCGKTLININDQRIDLTAKNRIVKICGNQGNKLVHTVRYMGRNYIQQSKRGYTGRSVGCLTRSQLASFLTDDYLVYF